MRGRKKQTNKKNELLRSCTALKGKQENFLWNTTVQMDDKVASLKNRKSLLLMKRELPFMSKAEQLGKIKEPSHLPLGSDTHSSQVDPDCWLVKHCSSFFFTFFFFNASNNIFSWLHLFTHSGELKHTQTHKYSFTIKRPIFSFPTWCPHPHTIARSPGSCSSFA